MKLLHYSSLAISLSVFFLLSLFGQSTANNAIVTSSSGNISRDLQQGSDYGLAVCGGKPNGKNRCKPLTEVAPVTATYGVRCCSDTEKHGFKKKNYVGCENVWAKSRLGKGIGCQMSATYTEALQFCKIEGGRLCTEVELLAKCAKSTGCGLNKKKVWSSPYIHIPNTYCQYYESGGAGSCEDGSSFDDIWQQCEDDGPEVCMGVMWSSCEGPTSDITVNGAWHLMKAGQEVGDADNPTDTCGGKEQASGLWDVFIRIGNK